MRGLRRAFAHIITILSIMVLVFLAIDAVNPAMEFINNAYTKGILWALCLCATALGVTTNAMRGTR